MRLGACARLQLVPENRSWYRALDPKYSQAPLGSAHTVASPSRFSPGPNTLQPFEILYFSETHLVAQYEIEALLGSLTKGSVIANPAQTSLLIISVRVELQQIADLTLVAQQRLLSTTAQELTGDWDGYQKRKPQTSVREPVGAAPTQCLGEALFSVPAIEGFRVVSAKVPTQMNLVVFPQKLQRGSRLTYYDGATGKTHVVKG